MAHYKNFTMSSWTLTDGTSGTALTHTLLTETGSASITEVTPGQLREIEIYTRKKAFVSAAHGAPKFPIFSLDAAMEAWKETSSGTLTDFFLGTTGTPYANRVSTIAPSGAAADAVPFACDIAGTIEGTDFGDSADHSGTMTDAIITSFTPLEEGSPNMIKFSATVVGALTGDFAVAVSV